MEKRVIVALFAALLLFSFLNFVFLNFMGVPFSPVAITGYAINDSGIVSILIEKLMNIFIYSPLNTTYNFNKGESYILELNVSADFVVDEWRYSLFDLMHNVSVEDNTGFTPNSSISAVRWGNLLTVFAHESGGSWHSQEVVFYVNVSNSAPILGNFSDPVLVCEGDSLSYRFNATDVDEDDLVGDISPKNPFYLSAAGRNLTVSFFDIVSGVLDKVDVGAHVESVSVMDPYDDVDIKNVNIEVIEINNLPVLENIGAQTVWLTGDDSTFSRVVNVSDVEDGVTGDGNFEFNLTWGGNEDLFDIGLTSGVMNYSPVVGHEGQVYSLQICVEDNALGSAHQNISFCSPLNENASVVCDSFSLTVTDENRAPVILNHSPVEDLFSVLGTDSFTYSVSVYDADGTIPDIDWYVDGAVVEHNENISNDTFAYTFGCGVEGAHSVRALTTDGLLNDSQNWIVSVDRVNCSVPSGGGGGGGSSGNFCIEDWFCDDWNVCQNVKKSFETEVLSVEDYSVTKDVCFQNKEEDDRFCGFQIRRCYDLALCERDEPILPRPLERGFCYFTENPSCFDQITNCHDGGCELLADCGGPCGPCATCSDGKQNQGEEGKDCGGPCPFLCEEPVPFALLSSILIVVAIVLVFVILWFLWMLFLLWRRRENVQ